MTRTALALLLLAGLAASACGGPTTARPDEPPTIAPPTAGTPGVGQAPRGDPDALVAEAKAAIPEGRLDQARRALLEATGLAPMHAEAQRLLADVLVRTGARADALIAAERAVQAAPEDYTALAQFLRLLARERAFDRAAAVLEPRIEAAPDDLALRVLQLDLMEEQGRHRDVIESARDLLRKDETNLTVMLLLAKAYRSLEQRELAEYVLTNALKIREDADVHHRLAELFVDRGSLQTALYHLQQAIALRPDFPEALNNLGVAYHWAGDDAGAVQVLIRAIALAPAFTDAHVNLGNAYRRIGQLAEAEAAYQQALALDPNLPAAYFNLGILYFEQTREGQDEEQRYSSAIEAFNRYKALAGASLPKDDPVDKYIAEARIIIEDIHRSRSEAPAPPPDEDGDGGGGEGTGDDGSGEVPDGTEAAPDALPVEEPGTAPEEPEAPAEEPPPGPPNGGALDPSTGF